MSALVLHCGQLGWDSNPLLVLFGDRTLAEDPHTVLVRDLAGTLAVNLNLLHALIRTNER
jgi:hypothetical protein